MISIPASQYHKIKWVEDERDGILESVAEVIEDPVWDLLMSGWRTVDPGDFAALAEAISSLQDELRNYVIADPLKSLDAALGFSDLSLLGAITEHVPIPGLDQSLGEIKQYLEIAGIILVAISGGHILACASFKMWAHDELGRLLGKLLNKLLHNLCEGPEESSEPGEPQSNGRRSPGGPDSPDEPPDSGPPSPPTGPDGPDDPDQPPPGSGPPSSPPTGPDGPDDPDQPPPGSRRSDTQFECRAQGISESPVSRDGKPDISTSRPARTRIAGSRPSVPPVGSPLPERRPARTRIAGSRPSVPPVGSPPSGSRPARTRIAGSPPSVPPTATNPDGLWASKRSAKDPTSERAVPELTRPSDIESSISQNRPTPRKTTRAPGRGTGYGSR